MHRMCKSSIHFPNQPTHAWCDNFFRMESRDDTTDNNDGVMLFLSISLLLTSIRYDMLCLTVHLLELSSDQPIMDSFCFSELT